MQNLLEGKHTIKQLANMIDNYESIALITGNYKPVTLAIDVCVSDIDTDFNTDIPANDIKWIESYLSEMCEYGDVVADRIVNHKCSLETGNMFRVNGHTVQIYIHIYIAK